MSSNKSQLSRFNPETKEYEGVPLTEPQNIYNKFAWEIIVKEKMEVLRARLLNLIDGISGDREQRKALKGLVKDFCNQAYFPLKKELCDFMIDLKVLEKDELFRAQSIDFLGDRELSIN